MYFTLCKILHKHFLILYWTGFMFALTTISLSLCIPVKRKVSAGQAWPDTWRKWGARAVCASGRWMSGSSNQSRLAASGSYFFLSALFLRLHCTLCGKCTNNAVLIFTGHFLQSTGHKQCTRLTVRSAFNYAACKLNVTIFLCVCVSLPLLF